MSLTLNVGGMSCGHCVARVEKALKEVPGVDQVEVLLDPGLAKIEGSADPQDLIKAVEAAGYQASQA